MLYRELAEMYSQIESTSGNLEKIGRFSSLLRKAHPKEISKIIALTLGKLHPDWKGEPEIGLAEKMAVQAVATAASVHESSVRDLLQKEGDLGSAAEKLLESSAQGTLLSEDPTVTDVYDALDGIARVAGAGSSKEKISRLTGLITDLNPLGARYLLRTVTGDLRLGLGAMSMIDALSTAFTGDRESRPYIERAFNLCSDLAMIGEVLARDGIQGIVLIHAEVGRPIRMMAAKKLSDSAEILEKAQGSVLVEWKYDGERVQVHKDGDRIVLFSRRQEDITKQYPDVVGLVRHGISASRCIVEGEIVAIDPTTGRSRPFQELMRRRRKTGIQEMSDEIPVSVFFFDILFLEGEDVTSQPMPKRRRLLESIVLEKSSVELSHGEITDEPQRIDEIFAESIDNGNEGIIAKAIHDRSTYQAGSRSWLWIKLKASYQDDMADSFDFVVVGAFHGRGKRTGVYGTILASAYDEHDDSFPTVCKIGTGFTDDMLAEFKRRLQPLRIHNMSPSVRSDVEADVWFEPKLVIEVVGDEITVSPTHVAGKSRIHTGGLAIRFPRFTGRWRDDKDPAQATSVDELIEMYDMQRER